jgi:multidrug efflux pump subunit AcrB
MGGLISYFVRHRTVANLLMVLIVVLGGLAVTQIRAQYFPDVVISDIEVSVQWDGAGAEDVDRGIVQVLEPALLAVDGVAYVSSLAREGRASIDLEFDPDTDITLATEAVQAAVDAARNLPDGADDPQVRQSLWRDGVTDVVITGPVGTDQLARFADEFVGRLFAEGVTRTTVQGLAAPQVVVEVPGVALMQHDVTLDQIARAIGAAVASLPAGEVADGLARVRTGTERRSVDEIGAIVLKSSVDGETLTIADVATLRAEGATRGRAAFVGDNPAMTVRVERTPAGDAIDIQARVATVAAEMQGSLPPGVTVSLVRARAEQIADRLSLLLWNGFSGLALVLVMLFLFLNARIALWVAAGIPIALLAAIGVMYLAGLSLNMVSLFALILVLGVVVDDSIVVSEYAEQRLARGEDALTASERAATRMAGPILASTLTTVMGFWGLVAIGGRFGALIADIPFTVIAVMLVSLIECFLILPRHIAHALPVPGVTLWYDAPSRWMNRRLDWLRVHLMKPLMRFVIRARYPVLAACVLALASQAALFLRGDVQFRFFDAPEQAQVTGNFAMLPGATRDDSMAMMQELQRAVGVVGDRLSVDGVNPVAFVMGEVGGSAGRGLASAATKDADLLGGISIELIDPDLRNFSSFKFIADLEAEIKPHPLMEEVSFRGGRFGPAGDAISVDLYGATSAGLKAAAEDLKARLGAFAAVSALEDSLAYDKDDLILNLTPQGQALGFDIAGLGQDLRARLSGIEAATYPVGARTASIRVELPQDELTADFLDRTLLRAPGGAYVPLADIVTVTRAAGFSSVVRENGQRVVTVTGDISGDDADAAAAVERALGETILPAVEAAHGVESRQSGAAADEDEFLGGALQGLILSLVGIYLVLSWVFASWTRPLVIMSVIPFGLVGAIFGHWWWAVPMSMFSIVGMIGMSGIIINDAIVLVSTVDEYAEKRGLFPAIVDGVSDRLRPVLLTTVTTIIGLAPLLYQSSSQAMFLKPTVVTLVYGLGFGMVLVLLVVPAMLAVQADVGQMIAAARRGLLRGPRLVWAAVLAVTAAFVVILAPALWAGEGLGIAFGWFVLGAGVICAAVWGVGRVFLRPARRTGPPPVRLAT